MANPAARTSLKNNLREPFVPREMCFRCLKAKVTCVCGKITAFASDPRLVILIHPREARNRVGTARMLHLSVTNSRLIHGSSFENDEQVNALIADPSLHCAMLYPGPASLDLTDCTSEQARAFIPPGKKLVLFLIDGTWDMARSMVNRSKNLHGLPQIRFTPSRPSGYGFRRQPHEFCFSTLEAAHWIIDRFTALGVSARQPGDPHDGLLVSFRAMVRQQLKYAERNDLRRTEGMRRAGPLLLLLAATFSWAALPAWAAPKADPKKEFIAACTDAFVRSSGAEAKPAGEKICECAFTESKHQGATLKSVEAETAKIKSDHKHKINDPKLLAAFQWCAIETMRDHEE